jgi:hypothetical protein
MAEIVAEVPARRSWRQNNRLLVSVLSAVDDFISAFELLRVEDLFCCDVIGFKLDS